MRNVRRQNRRHAGIGLIALRICACAVPFICVVIFYSAVKLSLNESSDHYYRPGRNEEDSRFRRNNSGRQTSFTPKPRYYNRKSRPVRTQLRIETAIFLVRRSKCARAEALLHELNRERPYVFITSLLLAECYLHSGERLKEKQMFETVKEIVVTSEFEPHEFKEFADNFLDDALYFRAIMLYRIASNLFSLSELPAADALQGIYSCIWDTCAATTALIWTRKVGIERGIQAVLEMHRHLKSVPNANLNDVAVKEAWTMQCLAFSFHSIRDARRVKYLKIGIEVLERQFGSKASEYRSYGILLHGMGTVYFDLKEFSKAEAYYVGAIEAIEKATDYEDEFRREDDLKASKTLLQNAREKLGQNWSNNRATRECKL